MASTHVAPCAVICWFLGVFGIVLFVAGISSSYNGEMMNNGEMMIIVGVLLYLAQFVELCCGKAMEYLSNIQSENEFTKYVARLQKASPIIRLTIQNYHYETRYYQEYDSEKGRYETKSKEERVNTHFASEVYQYRGYTDETLSPAQTVAMFHLLHGTGSVDQDAPNQRSLLVKSSGERILMLTCKFPVSVQPRDRETEADFERYSNMFFAYHTRDTHQERKVSRDVNCQNYKKHCMVILSTNGTQVREKPWWMNRGFLFLSTALMLGPFYRCYLYSRTEKVEWTVAKHFSVLDPATWISDPIHSIKHSSKIMAAVVNLGPNVTIVQREGGFSSLVDGCNAESDWESDSCSGSSDVELAASTSLEPPHYWTNQGFTKFTAMEPLQEDFRDAIQQLFDSTFMAKATRDRKGRVPVRLVVHTAHRLENSDLWGRYAAKRRSIAMSRPEILGVAEMEGSGPVKTQSILRRFNRQLEDSVNEHYLFHGSSPAGVLGIGTGGFDLKFIGTGAGSMFGPGAYFAESSSKGDEYASAEQSGLFQGKYAMLLCRVTCGQLFRITESNKPEIQNAMRTGAYDGVLGDREAKVGTYREFVVYDEAQIYPEYVVIYDRQY
eukprot:TRINITY_DN19358_c0_g1_i2.p1 TRINITY_DN19358_c0_g1~~TRINITY_DN19358_c0_g1_i2.p1  ORF type:complete len:609 (-),score=61.42 TRINITY_DN19358_c0_g1_i2:55-1881(-)